MEQSPAWGADNGSVGKAIHRLLWNQMVHYGVHKKHATGPQPKPVKSSSHYQID